MNLRHFAIRMGGAAMLASLLALTACNPFVKHTGEKTVVVPQHYDVTIGAYKDKQYLLNGAVLSASDLEAHFRYLEEQKELPKTVLLEDTDSAKVNNASLEEFASLQLAFHFTGYVLHKGKLTLMSAVEGKVKPGQDRGNEEQHRMRRHPGSFDNGGGMNNGGPTGG